MLLLYKSLRLPDNTGLLVISQLSSWIFSCRTASPISFAIPPSIPFVMIHMLVVLAAWGRNVDIVGVTTHYSLQMSQDTTKPTKWVCAQRRFRSAWASAQSDQSSLCAQYVAKDPSFLHADSEDSNQTGGCPGWSKSWLGAHSFCWLCHIEFFNEIEMMWQINIEWKSYEWKYISFLLFHHFTK